MAGPVRARRPDRDVRSAASGRHRHMVGRAKGSGGITREEISDRIKIMAGGLVSNINDIVP